MRLNRFTIKVMLMIFLVGVLLVAACGQKPAAPVSAPTPSRESLPVGVPAPDFILINQDGQAVNLSDFRGKVVLMNFVYTSCPGPCHLQNFDLLMVRNSLDEASREELVLVSISFDPEVDTPQVLKEYAQARGFDIPGWHFLTGSQDEIAKVMGEYGVVYELVSPEEHVHPGGDVHPHERGFNHMNQAVLIDQRGMLRRQYLGMQIGEQVLPREAMLEDVRALLHSEAIEALLAEGSTPPAKDQTDGSASAPLIDSRLIDDLERVSFKKFLELDSEAAAEKSATNLEELVTETGEWQIIDKTNKSTISLFALTLLEKDKSGYLTIATAENLVPIMRGNDKLDLLFDTVTALGIPCCSIY